MLLRTPRLEPSIPLAESSLQAKTWAIYAKKSFAKQAHIHKPKSNKNSVTVITARLALSWTIRLGRV